MPRGWRDLTVGVESSGSPRHSRARRARPRALHSSVTTTSAPYLSSLAAPAGVALRQCDADATARRASLGDARLPPFLEQPRRAHPRRSARADAPRRPSFTRPRDHPLGLANRPRRRAVDRQRACAYRLPQGPSATTSLRRRHTHPFLWSQSKNRPVGRVAPSTGPANSRRNPDQLLTWVPASPIATNAREQLVDALLSASRRPMLQVPRLSRRVDGEYRRLLLTSVARAVRCRGP